MTLAVPGVAAEGLVRHPASFDAKALAGQTVMGKPYWTILGSHFYTDPAQPISDRDAATGLRNLPLFKDAAIGYGFGAGPAVPRDKATWRTFTENFRDGERNAGWRALQTPSKPDAPCILSFHAKRRMESYFGAIDLDMDEYRQWIAKHPNVWFEALDEWANDIYGGETRMQSRWKDPTNRAEVAKWLYCFPKTHQGKLAQAKAYFDHSVALYWSDTNRIEALRQTIGVDHIAAACGAKIITLETGGTTGNTDWEFRWDISGFFIRGAARQFGIPWGWYVPHYINGYSKKDGHWIVYSTVFYADNKDPSQFMSPSGGFSPSIINRENHYAYVNGANMLRTEMWQSNLLMTNGVGATVLTPRGELLAKFHDFTKAHPDRGETYAPVAILTPFDLGYTPWGGWGWRSEYLGYRPGDHMVDGVFYTIVPGFDRTRGLRKGGEYCFHNGKMAMMYDVLVPDSPQDPQAFLKKLRAYPVAVLAGEYHDLAPVWRVLGEYVKGGGTLLAPRANVPAAMREKLKARDGRAIADANGATLATAFDIGEGRLIVSASEWMTPPYERTPKGEVRVIDETLAGKRKFPEIAFFLERFQEELFPFRVEGSCQFGANQTDRGWWLWMMNNDGVTKFADADQELDYGQSHAIRVAGVADGAVVRELLTGREAVVQKGAFQWLLGPGAVAIFSIEGKYCSGNKIH